MAATTMALIIPPLGPLDCSSFLFASVDAKRGGISHYLREVNPGSNDGFITMVLSRALNLRQRPACNDALGTSRA
jgi:hypothetical protein